MRREMAAVGVLVAMLAACTPGQQPDPRDPPDEAVAGETPNDTAARRRDSLRAQAMADTARLIQEAIARMNRMEAERVEAAMNEYPDNPAMRWILEEVPTCLRFVSPSAESSAVPDDASAVTDVAPSITRYVGGSVIGVEPGGLVSLPDSGRIRRRSLPRPTSRFAPVGPDSVTVFFGDGFTVPRIRVLLEDDALQGRATVTWDVGPTTDDLGPVRLERTACPEPGAESGLPAQGEMR